MTTATQSKFKAAFTDAQYGQRGILLVLTTRTEDGRVASYEHTLPVPKATGDVAHDAQVISAFEETARTWEKTGAFVPPVQEVA